MKFRTIGGLLMVLLVCSCIQRPSKNGLQTDNYSNQFLGAKTGLLIENRINRGINYTDPQGTDYNIRYIPITITNDSTISIQVQITFSKEYNNPYPYNEERFKLIPLPREWALDGADISESMIDELPGFIENPVLNETIAPGEQIVFAIGSLYPRPVNSTGVLPRRLFVQGEAEIFEDCDWSMEKDRSSNQQIPMGIKIIFGEKCKIIPCGKISYLVN
ncbi:MAG: hypothetical protein HKO01_08335 [Flaviramulus sp.]|nr:hypothetical protein [Flaviramulus sp.]NNC50524.1 hypothetical protein [Flaviramulus sp.]